MQACPSPSRVRARGRRRRRDPGQRGLALIMVLVITTIMGAVSADLENSAQVNLKAAANARDQLQAHFHARSALEIEMFVLRFQAQVQRTLGQFIPIPLFELSNMIVSSDTLQTIFLDEDERKKALEEASENLLDFSDDPFGDFTGRFWIEEVVDENRKINVNNQQGIGCQNFTHLMLGALFDDPKYDVLFESLGESRDPVRNRVEIIANITDWTDANNTIDPVCMVTGDQNAGSSDEEARYRDLPYRARYEPKNGMLNSLAELRMVPRVNDAFMQLFGPYLTVWGSGTSGISMRTAQPVMYQAVIRAVMTRPWVPGDLERFREFMNEKALLTAMPGANLSPQIMKSLLAQVGFPIDEARFDELVQRQVLRFEDVSGVYRITAMGQVEDATAKLTVVWRDDGSTGEIYYWRED